MENDDNQRLRKAMSMRDQSIESKIVYNVSTFKTALYNKYTYINYIIFMTDVAMITHDDFLLEQLVISLNNSDVRGEYVEYHLGELLKPNYSQKLLKFTISNIIIKLDSLTQESYTLEIIHTLNGHLEFSVLLSIIFGVGIVKAENIIRDFMHDDDHATLTLFLYGYNNFDRDILKKMYLQRLDWNRNQGMIRDSTCALGAYLSK